MEIKKLVNYIVQMSRKTFNSVRKHFLLGVKQSLHSLAHGWCSCEGKFHKCRLAYYV